MVEGEKEDGSETGIRVFVSVQKGGGGRGKSVLLCKMRRGKVQGLPVASAKPIEG